MSLIGNNVITLGQLGEYIDELRMEIVDLIGAEEVDEDVFDMWASSNADAPVVQEYQTLTEDHKNLSYYVSEDDPLVHHDYFDKWILAHLKNTGEIPDNPPFVIDEEATIDMHSRYYSEVEINGAPYLYA